jgi:hypothetical protein
MYQQALAPLLLVAFYLSRVVVVPQELVVLLKFLVQTLVLLDLVVLLKLPLVLQVQVQVVPYHLQLVLRLKVMEAVSLWNLVLSATGSLEML